jgi:hypothetical protein
MVWHYCRKFTFQSLLFQINVLNSDVDQHTYFILFSCCWLSRSQLISLHSISLTPWIRVCIEILLVIQVIKQFVAFYEPEGSLLCLQDPKTGYTLSQLRVMLVLFF